MSARQACHESCHCKLTQYIVFLILPHPVALSEQEVCRCNCSTCYKMNMFHVHPANPRNDFVLLSPLNPDHELSTYLCHDKKRKFHFCPKCGVSCFTSTGEGEIEVVDLAGVGGLDKGGATEIWHVKWDGDENTRPYLSVNGTTIDFREDFDLRVLTEQKGVMYLDGRSGPERDEEAAQWDRPHYGGSY